MPTGPATCDWRVGNSYDGWQRSLADYSLQTHAGLDGQASFDAAVQYVDRVVGLIDPERTGPRLAASTIVDYEHALSAFETCGAEGREAIGLPALGRAEVARWREILSRKADAFAISYGVTYAGWYLDPADEPVRNWIVSSPILSDALRRHAPIQMARMDAMIADTPEGRARAASEAAHVRAAASASARATALASMPERAGAWRRVGPTAYVRSAPADISARIECGIVGGLIVTLSMPDGSYFVSSENVENEFGTRDRVHAYAMIDGADRRFDAEILTRSGGPNQILYDNTVAIISIQSTRMEAAAFRSLTGGMANTIDQVTGVAREDNAASLMLQMFGEVAGLGIEGSSFRKLEIDQVRNMASLPLSIDAERPYQRVRLFDLAPTSAPFRNLMEACWS